MLQKFQVTIYILWSFIEIAKLLSFEVAKCFCGCKKQGSKKKKA